MDSSKISISGQLKFLSKVENYETKVEFNRFLLITSFGGLLCIMAGILELFFYKFYNLDVVYFQYNFLDSPDMSLLIAVWIMTIFPLLIIIIFSRGTSGIINWNKAYRTIGLVAIILFFLCELFILLIGKSNSKFIPLIWGIFIFLGMILASYLINIIERQKKVAYILLFLGACILIDALFVYLFIDIKLSMFTMLINFGVIMTGLTAFFYLFESRYQIINHDL